MAVASWLVCPTNREAQCSFTSASWIFWGSSSAAHWAKARQKVERLGTWLRLSQPHNRRSVGRALSAS